MKRKCTSCSLGVNSNGKCTRYDTCETVCAKCVHGSRIRERKESGIGRVCKPLGPARKAMQMLHVTMATGICRILRQTHSFRGAIGA